LQAFPFSVCCQQNKVKLQEQIAPAGLTGNSYHHRGVKGKFAIYNFAWIVFLIFKIAAIDVLLKLHL
jgi:hypothetical protein